MVKLILLLAVLTFVLHHAAASALLLDPICGDCESRRCTYSRRLFCSCRMSSISSDRRIVEIGADKTDREYARVSLGFAIDDTGSMSGVIESVKATVRGVVTATAGIFDKVVMATFNDPYEFSLVQSTDAEVVGRFVDNIEAHDGGDCAEMALSGIRDVASRVAHGSAIFVFTDASAKDLSLESDVESLLLGKDVRLNVLITGGLCGIEGLGGELFRLANATKGSVYRTPDQWDVQHVMNYIRKYARYGVRFIRGMPKSLDDLRTVVSQSCSCEESRSVQNLACTAEGPPPAAQLGSGAEALNATGKGAASSPEVSRRHFGIACACSMGLVAWRLAN